jgi:hypothetical protein
VLKQVRKHHWLQTRGDDESHANPLTIARNGRMTDNRRRPEPDDWRRQGQERYLAGARLIKQGYRPYRQGWAHDHCEFCWAKFSLEPGELNAGYSTEDCYHWICADCYEDFRDAFNWAVHKTGD